MGFLIARILMFFGMAEDKAVQIGQLITLATILSIVVAILRFMKQAVTYPLFLGAIILALTLFPDTVGWIFMKVGEIELRIFAIILTSIMPDIVEGASSDFHTWSQIWQQGINLLPEDVVDVCNSVGVAYLVGLVTSTIASVSTIKIYRKVMFRAGLL